MKVQPPNTFWLEKTLDQEMMDYLWSQIDKASVNYKGRLVGHISKSLQLPDKELKLTNLIQESAKELYDADFVMDEIWVNFQKKHEFNPVHTHSGQLSFVIWMKIPYLYEAESKIEAVQGVAEDCCAGCFEILYLDTLGQISRYAYFPIESKLLIFPAKLPHLVYPFYTSDRERISISGNLN